MGQVGDKCSCLFVKSEKTTYDFYEGRQPEEFSEEEVSKAKNKDSFVDQFMKKSKSNNNSTFKTYDDETGRDRPTYVEKSKKSFINTNPEADKNYGKNNKFKQLQSVIRGYLYRLKYPKLKPKLVDVTNKMIDKYQNLFRTPTLYRAESYKNSPFQKDGWKNIYPKEKNMFSFNYGRLVDTQFTLINDSAYYIGCLNYEGEKHGYGVLIKKNGCKYQGFWRNNSFIGWGRYIDSDGNMYEGYFEDGVLSAKGEKHSLTGTVYVGDFKNGMKYGIGQEETNEHTYNGEYRNDKKHGKGKLVYKAIKDIYEGEFKENAITGMGFYIWANKDTFDGTFLNGKMHGRGVYKWPDGGEYIGDYINNIKEGNGKFKWANGKIFEGPFKGGRPHGIGKLTIETTMYEVEFKEGKLVQTITTKPTSTSPKSSNKNISINLNINTKKDNNSPKGSANISYTKRS